VGRTGRGEEKRGKIGVPIGKVVSLSLPKTKCGDRAKKRGEGGKGGTSAFERWNLADGEGRKKWGPPSLTRKEVLKERGKRKRTDMKKGKTGDFRKVNSKGKKKGKGDAAGKWSCP